MKTAFLQLYHKKTAFYTLAGFLLTAAIILVLFDKTKIHLTMNQYHTPFFDLFFKYTTYLGDGIVFPIVIIVLLLKNRKIAPAFIYAGMLTLVISYILKNWVFIGFARPYEEFKDALHLVEGVRMRHWHSFPSGHTTAAFSLFILAGLFTKKKGIQLLWVTLAIIAGLSRIYLSQHFLQDVFAGTILGSFIALSAYQLYLNYPLFKK